MGFEATLFARHNLTRRTWPSQALVKIALEGTSCIGKSTILRIICNELRGQFVGSPEAAAHFFENDYVPEMGDRFSPAVQGRIQYRAVMHEERARHYAQTVLQSEQNTPLVVVGCDRTVWAAPVYLTAVGQVRAAAKLFAGAQVWVDRDPYDKVYLLDPAGVPYVNTAIRTEPPEMRARFHEAFVTQFAEHGIAHKVLSGTEQERAATVVSDIRAMWAAGAAT